MALRQALGGGDHVQPGRRVLERLPEKVVEFHRRAEAKAAAVGVGGDGIAGHGLGRHAQHPAGLAALQLIASLAQQLKPRAADALHLQRRHRLGHPGIEADMAWQQIGIETGLGHRAGQHGIHRPGLMPARQQRPRHGDAQVGGRHLPQGAIQIGPGRAHAIQQQDIVVERTHSNGHRLLLYCSR